MTRTFTLTIAAAALLGASLLAAADVTQKSALTLAGAQKVIAGAVAEARRLNTTAAIAVVDDDEIVVGVGNALALRLVQVGQLVGP